jgi:hypothetical protein
MNRDLHAPDAHGPPVPDVTLRIVAGCAGGECPTVYETDRGTLVVQGYAFEPAAGGVAVPSGEQMVEIPKELLASYSKSLR